MSKPNWTQWCSYEQVPNVYQGPTKQMMSIDEVGTVAPELRASGPNEAMPQAPPNGGLYGGPQSSKPWANIPITPTVANLIHYNLKSANPPPGATEQYPGTQRMGNNYQAMPGVGWYNPKLFSLQTL